MNDNAHLNEVFKVLVVDDERSVRFLLTQMLESEGYTVIEAADGENAVEMFRREKPDMILIDAMMPLLDGMSTCRIIRKLDGGQKIPVLMITGLDDDGVADMAFESGVSDFITKPFQFSVLRQRVKRMLRLKAAESMIEEKLSKERSITELVDDGIIIIDPGNRVISFNPSAEEIFGCSAAEIMEGKLERLIPELTDEFIEKCSAEADERKNIKIKKETAGVRKGGECVPLSLTLNGLDSGNKLISVRDLTENKQAQSTIKMAEMIFENIKEAICVVDSQCLVQSANPAFYELTGYRAASIIGNPLRLIITDPRSREAFDGVVRATPSGGQRQIEIVLTTKNKAALPVLMLINLIEAEGLPAHTKHVIIFHDITEQIKLRAKQEALQKQAVNIQKMTLLSTISAGIIHEINQPLNSIKILADSLIYLNKKGKTIEMSKVFENLQKISEQIVRIDDIIKQMRAFASYRQGQAATKCDLNAAVEKTHELLKHQLSLKGITLYKNLGAGLNEVPGNVNIIEEVALNLVVNAIQAFEKNDSKNKEIVCETRLEGDRVIFEVSDNATGIEEEIKERIFDPFFSTKTMDGGMGLGLAIVSSILNGYNGKIDVFNNARGGATFRVELPAAAAHEHLAKM